MYIMAVFCNVEIGVAILTSRAPPASVICGSGARQICELTCAYDKNDFVNLNRKFHIRHVIVPGTMGEGLIVGMGSMDPLPDIWLNPWSV